MVAFYKDNPSHVLLKACYWLLGIYSHPSNRAHLSSAKMLSSQLHLKNALRLGMVVCACNPGIEEAEVGGF